MYDAHMHAHTYKKVNRTSDRKLVLEMRKHVCVCVRCVFACGDCGEGNQLFYSWHDYIRKGDKVIEF